MTLTPVANETRAPSKPVQRLKKLFALGHGHRIQVALNQHDRGVNVLDPEQRAVAHIALRVAPRRREHTTLTVLQPQHAEIGRLKGILLVALARIKFARSEEHTSEL